MGLGICIHRMRDFLRSDMRTPHASVLHALPARLALIFLKSFHFSHLDHPATLKVVVPIVSTIDGIAFHLLVGSGSSL